MVTQVLKFDTFIVPFKKEDTRRYLQLIQIREWDLELSEQNRQGCLSHLTAVTEFYILAALLQIWKDLVYHISHDIVSLHGVK